MYQLISYIKFLLKSTNQHGVHSPFIFNFVTKCLYDKTNYPEYEEIIKYRNALIRNNDVIKIVDFGSGSRIFNSNERTTSAMVKYSGTPLKRTNLLYKISKYFKPNNSLELGTSLGLATQAMALGNKENQLISIEGCHNTALYTKVQLAKYKNIKIESGEFKSILPDLTSFNFDLIFFDGHHDKEATIQYFELLLPTANNDSVFIFDDIYWSKGMTEAWNFIKAHSAVTVSVDCFYLGFVFFRKEQVKEHFKIRL